MTQRKDILLENNIYKNSSDFEKEKNVFENYSELNESEFENYADVIDENKHSLELSNWLDFKI